MMGGFLRSRISLSYSKSYSGVTDGFLHFAISLSSAMARNVSTLLFISVSIALTSLNSHSTLHCIVLISHNEYFLSDYIYRYFNYYPTFLLVIMHEGRWKNLITYIEQNCFSKFLSMQYTNRGQLAVD